jgi:hypothetical protein
MRRWGNGKGKGNDAAGICVSHLSRNGAAQVGTRICGWAGMIAADPLQRILRFAQHDKLFRLGHSG